MSHPSVHPMEAPPITDAANPPPRVRMKDIQGMAGTAASLALRFCQFCFAAVSLWVMAATPYFPSITVFRYLVAAAGLQSLRSLSLTIVDIYALLVKRRLQNSKVVSWASASAGITVLVDNDLNNCGQNHCTRFETAATMAFMSWFAVSPSFLLNFWSLASIR